MTFSNPAGETGAAAERYVRALLDLLGERDPLEVYIGLVPAIERAIAGLTDAALHQPERPGKWSIAEVVQHLADSDLVFGYRVRMVLAQPGMTIQAYDQDLWARELEYPTTRVEDSQAQLGALRAANARLLRSLDQARLARFGIHAERGEESVAKMLKLFAAHDLVHLRQIERIKTTLG